MGISSTPDLSKAADSSSISSKTRRNVHQPNRKEPSLPRVKSLSTLRPGLAKCSLKEYKSSPSLSFEYTKKSKPNAIFTVDMAIDLPKSSQLQRLLKGTHGLQALVQDFTIQNERLARLQKSTVKDKMDHILGTLPSIMSGSSKRIYTLLSKAGFSPSERFKQRRSDSDADFPISGHESKLGYILEEFGQLHCALKQYFSFTEENQVHLDSILKDYERMEEESLLLRQVLSQSSSATENYGEPMQVLVQQIVRPVIEMVEISTDTMDLLNPTADKELQTDSVAEVKPQVVIEYRELPKPVMLDKAILVCPASREVASGLDEEMPVYDDDEVQVYFPDPAVELLALKERDFNDLQTRYETDIRHYEEKLAFLQNDYAYQISNLRVTMQEEIDRLKDSNKTKDTRIELAHREIQELNLKISNLEKSCASLQKACEGLEFNVSALQESELDLQQKLSLAQRELRLSVKAKDELNASFKTQSEKMATIQKENDEVADTNAHLNATLSDLLSQNAEMQMTIEISAENEQMLLEKKQALTEEVAMLNGVIERHEKSIQDLLDVKAQLEAKSAELEAQIEAIMEFEPDSLLEGKDLSAKNVAKIQKLVHGNSERIMLLEKKNNVFRELLREHTPPANSREQLIYNMGSQWDLYEKNLFIKANQVIQGLREERTSPKEEPRRAETPNNLTITDAEARYSSRPRSSRPQTGKSTRSHVSWQLKPETPRPASSASQRETKIAAQWTPIGKQVQILTKFPPLAQLEGRLNEIELDVWKFPKPNLGREMPSRCVFAVNQ